MTCAPTDRLMQTLRVHVPGAGDDLLQLELFNVIDEFLRRTSAWKYENEIQLLEEELEYDLQLPGSSAVVRVMSASHNGIPVPNTQSGVIQASVGTLLPELTFPDGDAVFAPFQISNPTPGLFTWAIYKPTYISFTGIPDQEGLQFPFKLVLALSIAKQCLEQECGDWELPEWMFDMYFEDWCQGVYHRMYGMPAKPWTNERLALFHGRNFRNKMNQRKQEAQRGFAYNVQTWHFPRNGWTR